jgi:hypothetical protein
MPKKGKSFGLTAIHNFDLNFFYLRIRKKKKSRLRLGFQRTPSMPADLAYTRGYRRPSTPRRAFGGDEDVRLQSNAGFLGDFYIIHLRTDALG